MKYIVSLIIILGLCTPSFAIFGNRCHSNCNVVHRAPVVVVQTPTIITQTKIIVPTRVETYSEVKGLRLLEDLTGQKFIEINGRIINLPPRITEDTKEVIQNNKIVVEQTVTQF